MAGHRNKRRARELKAYQEPLSGEVIEAEPRVVVEIVKFRYEPVTGKGTIEYVEIDPVKPVGPDAGGSEP